MDTLKQKLICPICKGIVDSSDEKVLCLSCNTMATWNDCKKKNNVFSSEQVGASKSTLNIQLLRYSRSYI